MKKTIYVFFTSLVLCLTGRLLAQPAYALRWAEKIGVTASNNTNYSLGGKTVASKATLFNAGFQAGTPVDLDPGPGTSTVTGFVFIRRITTSQQLLWAKGFNNSSTFTIERMITDNAKNIYLAGWFSTSMAVDPGVDLVNVSPFSMGTADAIVIKLDSMGNYKWHARAGGANQDKAIDIAYDQSSASVYVTGEFRGTVDFDPGASVVNMSAGNTSAPDVFVWKLNATTGAYVNAYKLSNTATGAEVGNAIACDASGNVYVGGYYNGNPDFDPSAATATVANVAGGSDAFVAKYASGGSYQWAKVFGGPTYQSNVSRLVFNATTNELLIGGDFTDLNFVAGGSFTLTNNSLTGTSNDIFCLKANPLTGSVTSAWQLGGGSNDALQDLVTDHNNNVYIGGVFFGTANLNPLGSFTVTPPATGALFFTKMNANNTYAIARYFGGGFNSSPGIANLCVNDSSEIIVAGSFGYTGDFDPDPVTTLNLTAGPNNVNGFLINYKPCNTPLPVPIVSNTTICQGQGVVLMASGTGTVNWYASNTSSVSLASGSSYTLPVQTTSGVVTYYVADTTGCGLSGKVPLTVTVGALPVVNASSTASVICVGQSATLSASGAVTYTWTGVVNGSTLSVSPVTTTTYAVFGTGTNGCSGSATYVQNVSTCTGLGVTESGAVMLRMYPNPAHEQLVIRTDGNWTYRFINTLGEQVISGYCEDGKIISLADVPAGMYTIVFSRAGETVVQKLLKY